MLIAANTCKAGLHVCIIQVGMEFVRSPCTANIPVKIIFYYSDWLQAV